MAAKYRKLHPDQLLGIAGEVTAAIRAVIVSVQERRVNVPKARARNAPACESHQIVHAARELNSAMRSLSDLATPFREELFQAAKAVRAARRQKRRAAPKCGALKAGGGRCGTRLEPGQFRCPLHAQELRQRRDRMSSPTPRERARREVPGEAHDAVDNDAGTCSAAGGPGIDPTFAR
jgi:hypothetical protein